MADRVRILLLTCWMLQGIGVAAEPGTARKDFHGDPLPEGAVARLGTTRLRSGPHATSIGFSPDGKILASHGGYRGLTLWDSATGRELSTFSSSAMDFASPCKGFAFSPDGKTIATIEKDRVHLWEIATGKRQRTLDGYKGNLSAVLFTPDGKTLLTLTPIGLVSRDLRDNGPLSVVLESDSFCTVALSHDGDLLAIQEAHRVGLWSRPKARLLHAFELGVEEVVDSALAPDGKTLACLVSRSVILFDTATGKRIDAVPSHRASRLSWCPDGKILAVGSAREISLLDVPRRKWVRRWAAHATGIVGLACSPGGKQLASLGMNDAVIGLWAADSGKDLLTTPGQRWGIGYLALTPDGKQLFTHSWDGTVVCWDRTTGDLLRQFKGSGGGDVSVMALSPDGRTTVVADESSSAAVLCDAATGKLSRRLPVPGRAVSGLTFSRDGKLLAVATKSGETQVTEVASGKEVGRLTEDRDRDNLAFTLDGQALLTSNDVSLVQVWGVRDGKELCRMETGFQSQRMASFPDGAQVAIAGQHNDEHALLILDVSTRSEVNRWRIPAKSYRSIAVSPDGQIIATGGDGDSLIRLWEVSSGRLIRQFKGHYCGVSTLAFAERGRTLLSGSWDTSVLIWDVTGLQTPGPSVQPLTPQRLALLWEMLADADPARAYSALWELVGSPSPAVPFLRERLRAALQLDERLLTQLVADLDHRSFRVREQAADRLLELGIGVEPALGKLLASMPTLEQRRRAESLLKKLSRTTSRLQTTRAVLALEHAGTEKAWKVLEELALLDPCSSPGQQARAAVARRMKK